MNKAFEIEYKHKKVEIHIIDFEGDVRNINGTPDLFSLSYNSNVNDKGQYILATEAEINIYEDVYFNIDELKTVGETDILIKYFEHDELVWQGFVLPDFFQTGITNVRVLRMIATDRIGVLKDIANTSVSNTPKEIIEECLLQTGLTLPVEIRSIDNYLTSTIIERERIEGVSAYDVIRTFMVQFNSKIVQYKNKWWVVNKKLLEDGFLDQDIIDIDLVYLDGQREIKPTASEVSLFLEFGGSKKYPKNWNFRETDFNTIFKNWSVQPTDRVNTAKIIGYNVIGTVQTPIYGDSVNVPSLQYVSGRSPALGSVNPLLLPTKKSSFTTFSLLPNINYTLDFRVNFTSASSINIHAYILLKKGNKYFVFFRNINRDILLGDAGTGTPTAEAKNPIVIESAKRETFGAVQTQWNLELPIDRKIIGLSDDETDTFEVQIIIMRDRSYTSPITETTIVIHSAELVLIDGEVTGKGLIFKTKQGGDKFSKVRETETTLFSDKINQGVNGYFYNYKYDDTSITNLPKEYLLGMTRQMADMFCSARDFYSLGGKFKVNPLARYRCGDKHFVFVGGVSHRETAEIDIEEIVSNDTLIRTDYIYTYFEDSKDNIKSIGTASGSGGGGGTGGGGITSSQLEMLTNLADWWRLDEENDAIYSLKSVYSLKGVSALGLGSGGGGGGGDFDRLDAWVDYNETKANWVLSALLGYDLHTRVNSLEAGGGDSNIDISTTGSGNAVTGVSLSGNTLTFEKSSIFALSSHNHTIAQITGLQGALDLKATQSDIDTAIDAIEIGGRNLTKHSDILNWSNFGNIQLSQGVDDFGSYYRYLFGVLTSAGNIFPNIEFKENAQYVFSAEGKLDTGVFPAFRVWYTDGSSSGNLSYGGVDEPIRVDYITEKGKTIDYIEHRHNSNGYVRLYNIQLIEGNKIRTDWTPAPEDQVSDWNVTDVNSFAFLKNKPTQLSQFTDNIGVASHIANKANPHTVTTAQIGAVNLTTNQTIGGFKTFTGRIVFDIGTNIQDTDGYAGVWNVGNLLWRFGASNVGSITNIRGERVGIGTDNPLYKLDVAGDGRFTGNVIAPTFTGALSGNASSATKLQTARNIAGVPFDGTANIAIPFANLSSKPTTLSEYGITDAVTTNTAQTITGAKTFSNNVNMLGSLNITGEGGYSEGIRIKGVNGVSSIWFNAVNDSGYDPKMYGITVNSAGLRFRYGVGSTPSDIASISNTGNITASAGINTPKVDFGNGFTIEPSGTELVFKYNGVIKQRMLSNGTILATGGITALST